jgi:hypothetical protein
MPNNYGCMLKIVPFFGRYLQSNDFLETWGFDQPIADLRFDLDIDKVENIISGLSKQSSPLSNFKR